MIKFRLQRSMQTGWPLFSESSSVSALCPVNTYPSFPLDKKKSLTTTNIWLLSLVRKVTIWALRKTDRHTRQLVVEKKSILSVVKKPAHMAVGIVFCLSSKNRTV